MTFGLPFELDVATCVLASTLPFGSLVCSVCPPSIAAAVCCPGLLSRRSEEVEKLQ